MIVPANEVTKRLALLYGRKKLFHWSDAEGKAYLKLDKEGFFDDLGELALIEQYYAAERAKKDGKGIHRRDMLTFLNHAHGERDRAVAWAEKNPQKVVRASSTDAEPAKWRFFLAAVYPTANPDWRNAPGSIKAEFKEWEKRQ